MSGGLPGSLRLATRGSRLARTQSEMVGELLRGALARAGGETSVTLVIRTTQGDRDRARPLAEIGGQGLFTKELERALLAREADFAVHSLKDVPSADTDGLILAAFLPRERPGDALVTRERLTLDELPRGAKVATGSPRRRAQILARRPDLAIEPARGNVDTRLARCLEERRWDAVVLAQAGLARLGLGTGERREAPYRPLDPPDFLPAPGQGILGVQCREDDAPLRQALALLDDPSARAAALAERAFLRELDAGCQTSAAAWARLEGRVLRMDALHDAATVDGALPRLVRWSGEGDASRAGELGTEAARRLLELT